MRKFSKWICCAITLSTMVTSGESQTEHAAQPHVFAAALHIHTEVSSGQYSLPVLTEIAKKSGTDVVFLSDSLSENIQIGVPGFRHVFWANWNNPSIATTGLQNYFDRIQKENNRQGDVLYIPGLELVPRFFWSGSLLKNDLVCHNHQRNLIITGIDQPDKIRNIPLTSGYLRGRNTLLIIVTRALTVLLVLVCLAAIFFSVPLARRSGYSFFAIFRSFLLVLVCPLLLVALALNTMLSFFPKLDIYSPEDTATFEQKVLDAVKEAGWLQFWAHPEASDHHEFRIRGRGFSIDTRPYPEVLSQTHGYTGFAGVNEGANCLVEAGNVWDRLLQDYIGGLRKDPIWCFGEMLYHYEGQAKTKYLGNVETMIRASEKTPAALLAALKNGDFYARRNADGQKLNIDRWEIKTEAEQNTILITVSSETPGASVEIILIRNGSIIDRRHITTPSEVTFTDAYSGNPAYYRALVEGQTPLRAVTNPIFIVPRTEAETGVPSVRDSPAGGEAGGKVWGDFS